MSKFLSLLLCFCFTLTAADFKKAEESINRDLLKLNRQLDGQRTDVFQEREGLRREIAQAEREQGALGGSEVSILKEIAELESELKKFEKSLKNKELVVETVRKQIRDMRRNAELAVPAQYGTAFKSDFENLDKVLDEKNYKDFFTLLFGFQQKLLTKGFALNESAVQGVAPNGTVSEMKLYSLGHAKYFLSDGSQAGLLKELANENYPEMEAVTGLEGTLSSLASGSEQTLPFDFTDGLATKADLQEKSVLEHFQAGGVIIYPLALLGFICILAGAYKTVQLYTIRSQYDDKVRHLVGLIRNNQMEEADKYVNSLKNPVGSLLKEALTHHEVSRENLEEYLSETILAQMPNLDKFLTVLSVSAGAAPLLGLLGTVMGIIKTFEMIGIYGTGDANRLAGGISEALVTTEMGLIVAIPALIWHAVLNRRLRKIVSNLEKAMLSFINALSIEGKA
ncbi:MAG: MotA/TolQ/ExbB proton channel family protein [Lentisphaerales bacterium]|nr:MotA/TolQ/ExbB proton channel family protein [Lentisphaerales bacterium]